MSDVFFICSLELPNGDLVTGQVTTVDFISFLFVAKGSELDIWVQITKGPTGWYKNGGQSITPSESLIRQLGEQVDFYMSDN